MLISITITNWRSHENTTIEFKKGPNLLIGVMGSGKSSILDAICFALFGNFPSLEHKLLTLSEVIMHFKNKAQVSLKFSVREKIYVVKRTIVLENSKVRTEAELRDENNKLLAKGTSEVTSYISSILGIDYSLYTRAIYSNQNNIDYFLSLSPSKLKKELDELLEIDKFEKARANVISIINFLKDKKKIFESEFKESELEDLKNKIASEEKILKDLKEKKREDEKKLENILKDLKIKENEFLTLSNLKRKYEYLIKEIAQTQGAIKSLEKLVEGKEKNLDLYEKIKNDYNNLRIEVENIEREILTLSTSLLQVEKSLGDKEAQLKNIADAREKIKMLNLKLDELLEGKNFEELKIKSKNLFELNKKLNSLKILKQNEISRIVKSLNELNFSLTKCPTCGAPLNEESIKILHKELNDEKIRLEKEIIQVENDLKENEREITLLDEKIRKINELLAKLSQLKENVEKEDQILRDFLSLQEKQGIISKELDEKKSKKKSMSEELKLIEFHLKECEMLKKNFEKIESEKNKLEKLNREISNLMYSEEAYNKALKDIENLRIEKERIQTFIRKSEENISLRNEIFLSYTKRFEELTLKKEKLKKLTNLIEELSIYAKALEETQLYLRNEMIVSLNKIMNEIWYLLYPYSDYSKIRIKTVEDGYAFEVFSDEWRKIEITSGGERATIALVLRIALAAYLVPNLSLIILDEPTHNLDKDAVKTLADVIQNKLPSLVDQCIVITHDENMIGLAFGTIYKIERDKNQNQPSSVKLLN